MAKSFPKRGIPTTLTKGLLCLCLLCIVLPARPDSDLLKPYRAVYHISKNGLSTDIQRQLKQQKNGDWVLRDTTSILFFTMEEQARVRLNSNQLSPVRYDYEQSPGGRKNQTIHYNWDKNIAICTMAKKTRKAVLSELSYDKLSYQVQLRLNLLSGQFGETRTYTLVDRGRLKQYRVDILGEETIVTEKGPIKTIKLRQTRIDKPKDRETFIWMAPDYDYLMIKLEHHDDDDHYELLLKSATLLSPEENS